MRSALALILTAALLATGTLVALDLALVVGPGALDMAPQRPDASSSDAQQIARGFYDAANELLAGENAWALTAVVSPRVVTHAGSAVPLSGQEALAEHVAAMQRQGALRLRVVQVVGGEHDLTALIEAHAVVAPQQAQRDDEGSVLWRTIDRFRVADGMIVEYWPGAIESRPLPPLPSLAIPAPAGDAAIALARLELAPGATLRALAIPAPWLLLVENGTLTVSRGAPLAVARAGETRFDWQPAASSGAFLLGPGDAVFEPEGAGQAIVNGSDQPVSLLSMLVTPRDDLYGPKHDLDRDLLTVVAMHDPKRIGRRTAWANGVASETLAVGDLPNMAPGSVGSLAVTGDRLTLEPGERARPLTAPALTFGIVSSGTLHAEAAAPRGERAATPAAGDGSADSGARLLRAGDALAMAHGDVVTMENAGASRLDVTLIAVNAAPVAASPAPG